MATVNESDLWLEAREDDLAVDPEELPKMPPFLGLKSPKLPGRLKTYPTAVILRRYRKGDVICRQGEAGGTVFRILTAEELTHYRDHFLHTLETDKGERLIKHRSALSVMNGLISAQNAKEVRAVAEVHLAVPERGETHGPHWAGTLLRKVLGGRAVTADPDRKKTQSYIPIDGPRDLDYMSRTDSMFEGELFGEMSCMNRAPRATTVVAIADCYVVEMLPIIFELLQVDPVFKEKLDQEYRKRFLKLHLQAHPLLEGLKSLSTPAYMKIRDRFTLVDVQPGQLIFDENDAPDCMYLIRNGIVKVVKNATFLLSARDIAEPGAFVDVPKSGDTKHPMAAEVFSELSFEVRQRLMEGEPSSEQIVGVLNAAIKEGILLRGAKLQRLAVDAKIGLRVWQSIAAPQKSSIHDLRECQRTLLGRVYDKAIPAVTAALDDGRDSRFHVDQFNNWPSLAEALCGEKALADPLKRQIHDRLPENVRVLLKSILPAPGTAGAKSGSAAAALALKKKAKAEGESVAAPEPVAEAKPVATLDAEGRAAVVEAINVLVDELALLTIPEILDLKTTASDVRLYLPNQRAWIPYDTLQAQRAYQRMLLEAAFPGIVAKVSRRTDLPTILNYRSGREFIGEIALMTDSPRTASCIAYSHPVDDPKRPDAPVRLVSIDRALFNDLKELVPGFAEKIQETIKERTEHTRTRLDPQPKAQSVPRLDTPRADDLGLPQGQALMLIDLERCTRCDECVKACVNTHEDGRSRLYLDGPRVGSFLVPSTCRSCLDPICSVRCPVNAIERGDLGEMIIKDHCIGCSTCAEDCPYGSIQMHDIGLIPSKADSWRFIRADRVRSDWYRPRASESGWGVGSSPFQLDRDFRGALLAQGVAQDQVVPALCFRYTFEIPKTTFEHHPRFMMTVLALDAKAEIWLNGRSIVPSAGEAAIEPLFEVKIREPRAKGTSAAWKYEIALERAAMQAGRNVLAIKADPGKGGLEPFLDVRLDKTLTTFAGPESKPLESLAVVCDLCHTLEGGPACVSNCPHEAAIRVHAPTNIIGNIMLR